MNPIGEKPQKPGSFLIKKISVFDLKQSKDLIDKIKELIDDAQAQGELDQTTEPKRIIKEDEIPKGSPSFFDESLRFENTFEIHSKSLIWNVT